MGPRTGNPTPGMRTNHVTVAQHRASHPPLEEAPKEAFRVARALEPVLRGPGHSCHVLAPPAAGTSDGKGALAQAPGPDRLDRLPGGAATTAGRGVEKVLRGGRGEASRTCGLLLDLVRQAETRGGVCRMGTQGRTGLRRLTGETGTRRWSARPLPGLVVVGVGAERRQAHDPSVARGNTGDSRTRHA